MENMHTCCCLWVWLVCWGYVAHNTAGAPPNQLPDNPHYNIPVHRTVNIPSLPVPRTRTCLGQDCAADSCVFSFSSWTSFSSSVVSCKPSCAYTSHLVGIQHCSSLERCILCTQTLPLVHISRSPNLSPLQK